MGRVANGARRGKDGRTPDRRPETGFRPFAGREPPYARDFPMHRGMQPRNHEESGLVHHASMRSEIPLATDMSDASRTL